MFALIESLTASGLAGTSTIASGSLGTVIYTIIGVIFLVIVLGLIYSVIQAVKRFQGGSKRRG